VNTWPWKRLPSNLRNTSLCAGTEQFCIGLFLVVQTAGSLLAPSSSVLDCSIGAEIYSISSTIRAARPDLNVRISAVDNSAQALKVSLESDYTTKICKFVFF
jgi:hypothetical protein